MNNDVKTMLALAALTYRGFGKHSEAAIDAALRPWLPKLDEEGLGTWNLVWGPAAFHARTSLFDDAMVYVAKQQDRPGANPRYAVAVRGTNPVSLFDWIFGDFWVSLQIDWNNPGNPPAKLSASTALGMAIVKHLAAEKPPSQGSRFDAFGNLLSSAFEHFAETLPQLEPAKLLQKPPALTEDGLQARIKILTQLSRESSRLGPLGSLFDRFVEPIQGIQEKIRRKTFDKLVGEVESSKDKGQKLLDFLKTIEPNATVAVTGHSKGGALSIATALWLAEEWAPSHPGQVEAFAFAGPTPGNGAFKKRYDDKLGARTFRVINALDVVPHAFDPNELRGLREVYPALSGALKLVADSADQLGYVHVGGTAERIESKKAPERDLVQEMIYQHLDAYLVAAKFRGSSWNARSIFLDA